VITTAIVSVLALVLQAPQAAAAPALEGPRAERFLAAAEILDRESLDVGVTQPQRLTLAIGPVTARAVWKTIDEFRPLQQLERGRPEMSFRDTYKHEIAAYELDKLLGLGMVPPTVEREIRGTQGSLQLWMEGCITEWERIEEERRPPSPAWWNFEMAKVRLFHQLIYDTDRSNVRNLLVDPDFRIYIIDSGRAFRLHHGLDREEGLTIFSRALLERLRALTPVLLTERLGAWLTPMQIEALLARRDLVVARADELVAERGQGAVLYE